MSFFPGMRPFAHVADGGDSCPAGTYSTWDATRNTGVLITSDKLDNNQNAVSGCDLTNAKTSGKFYFEIQVNAVGSPTDYAAGICGTDVFTQLLSTSGSKSAAYRNDGKVFVDSTVQFTGTTWNSVNDVVGIAFDADTGKVWFKDKNGSWLTATNDADVAAGNNPDATINSETLGFRGAGRFGGNTNHTDAITVITAAGSFTHTYPAGFCEMRA